MAQTGGGWARRRWGRPGTRNAWSRAGGRKGPSAPPSCSSRRKPTEDSAPRSPAPAPSSRWRGKLPLKDGAGAGSSSPQTSATPPTPRNQMPSAPGLRSRDGETLVGIGTHPRATPTRQERSAVPDGRQRPAAGMRRWRRSSGGVCSPGARSPRSAPGPTPLRSAFAARLAELSSLRPG